MTPPAPATDAPAATAPAAIQPPTAPRVVRITCYVVFALIAAGLFRTGLASATHDLPDFEYFYEGGRALLVHGSLDQGLDQLPDGQLERRGTIAWYLPAVSRFMTLIAWLPQRAAGIVWLCANVLALLTAVRLVGQYLVGLPRQDWPVTQLVPFMLLAGAWLWEFRLNQIDMLTLLLLVAAFVHWQQRHGAVAGIWVGLATLLKLTPALIVLWFLLKRQWRVVGVAALTIAVAGPVADAIVLGPQQAVDEYRGWFKRAVVGGSHRALIIKGEELDWRNQASGAVLARWLTRTSYATHFDNDPRFTDYREEPRYHNIADWPPERVALLHSVLAGLCVVGLVLIARRPAGRLSLWQLRIEWALFMLAMLWLMPVMRRYHVVLAFPAVAMVAAVVHYAGHRSWFARLAYVCIGLVVVMQGVLITRDQSRDSSALEAGGVILGGMLVLGIPLVVARLWLARRPRALPPDAYVDRHPAAE